MEELSKQQKQRLQAVLHDAINENVINDLLEKIADLEPEQVFDEDVLHDWAKANGFVIKPEETVD